MDYTIDHAALREGEHAADELADALKAAGVRFPSLRGDFPVAGRPFVHLGGVSATAVRELGRVVRIFAGVRRQLRHLAALSDRPRTPSTRTILRLAMHRI
ncbi:hypothetical protein [Streptomyces sp. NPDC050560]|uniref:hypothetical protein n=1 Tax=Streptomyces sp. NPDC050560 TaxID=3365630 RepID=UPI00379DEF09